MTKASDNLYPKVLLDYNSSDQAAPANASWKLYAKAAGIYARSSNAVVGPFGAASSGVATDTIFDAKGDLAVGTGADTASKLTVGTNGYVLTADSAQSTGVKWASATPTYVGCKVTRTATQSISTASITAVQWDSESGGWDTATMHDNSTNNTRITVPTTGKWLLQASIVFAASGSGTERYAEFYLNATTRLEGSDFAFSGSTNTFGMIQMTASLTASDYVEVRVYQDSGGALNILQSASRYPYFSATLLGT